MQIERRMRRSAAEPDSNELQLLFAPLLKDFGPLGEVAVEGDGRQRWQLSGRLAMASSPGMAAWLQRPICLKSAYPWRGS